MSLVVVFGKKLNPDGSLHPKFQHRLDVALKLATEMAVERVIISGGKTREGLPSEAQSGRDYLVQRGIVVPIELEEESQTTMQNLEQVERLVLSVKNDIFIVISESSYERVRAFCDWYFPELYQKINFVQAGGGFALRDFLLNLPFRFLG